MTERIALHTRLKPGKEADYERIHARISGALDERLRASGVTAWTIWRSGRELFHVVDVDDFTAMNAALDNDPVNVEWQARMAELLEVDEIGTEAEDDGDGDGRLRHVWSLPEVAP